MAPPLLRLENIMLTFGGKPLIDNAAFSVHAGDRIALIGRNGSGKSTLLKIAAGITDASDGDVMRDRKSTIRYLAQAPDMAAFATVGDYIRAGLSEMDDPYRASYLAAELGLDETRTPDGLSGGEMRRAALARTLAPEPDILLLDEPTNHLDLPVIEWLESELKRTKSAIVLISHDRRFLENISEKTLWLDRGRLRENGQGFAQFEDWRDKLLEEEEQELHKLGRKIVREEHWVTHGVSGRRKRNMRRLGELSELKSAFKNHQRAEGTAKLEMSDVRSSGKLVIEADKISKSYGENHLVKEFSLRIHRGDCIGLIGPNGAGKTTLIKMLIAELQPDSGTVRHGTNLDIAMLDQRRDALKPDETLEHFLTDGRGQTLVVNGEEKHVASYMKDFLFKPEQARTPVRELSGGEKARLILAKLLARSNNLLVLDEPTNDLDMETLDLLQEMIADFKGTVLLVSHDRDFLDKTVNAVIAPDADNKGRWIAYAGGYSDMQAQLKQAQQTKADTKKELQSQKPQEAQSAARNSNPKGKLSFKQKYALETLPKELENIAAKMAALSAKMANPSFFAHDPVGFNACAKDLGALEKNHAAMEEQWLELEMLREELDG
ncbi:MAG: ATP-binding cassette domain-containing protein [Ahrensia sp.]|nr:ATP-binding cassette domain-containing protein [Ahrensia sp.]